MKLRVKFFIFLVALPSVALMVFLVMAFRVLVQDKTLYILEANMTLASTMAQQIDAGDWTQVNSLLEHLPMIQGLVLSPKGQILAGSKVQWRGKNISALVPTSTIEKLGDTAVDEGSFEDQDLNRSEFIYNYVRLAKKNALLVLMTPKASALRASLLFLIKAMLTFVLLVTIAVGSSLWLSKSMTGPIEVLRTHMQNFANGNFKVTVPPLGTDEIGQLGGFFNKMVKQIQGLIVEREEKLKIEVEMNLASDIQRQLFPNNSFRSSQVEFSGYYEPASNCGGDWWFYFQYQSKFVVCIGDVTGHGVHSALLTSASRSAFSIISKHFIGTSDAMETLNQCIYDTAQGTINMTCVIAAIDLLSGEVEYTNASHEAPVILPSSDGPVKKKQFVFMADLHGPRLGEKPNSKYGASIERIEAQQHIFFYSDGVTDIKNKKQEKLGERELLKWLGQNYRPQRSTSQEMAMFEGKVREYRRDEKLPDDLSYFFVKWSGNANAQSA